MNTYEIHNITTGEILVDNLSFDDMAEQLQIYIEFYSTDEIVSCYRITEPTAKPHKITYKEEYVLYMEYIADNIY